MKILLIRHGKSVMKWETRYTSEEYNKACEEYDNAGIFPIDAAQDTGDYERICVSTKKRAVQTAKQLFPSAPEDMIRQTPLLDEVPLRAFDSSPKKRHRWVYELMGRLQWRFGSGQDESYGETKVRADRLIEEIEKENRNVILVSHGFFLEVLLRRLKKRGRYEVYRSSLIGIAPLEKIRVIDKQPHCGGCRHNCPLKNQGCVIGQDKAALLNHSP